MKITLTIERERKIKEKEKIIWVDTFTVHYILLVLAPPFIIPKHDDFLLNGKSSLNVVQINCINWKENICILIYQKN